METSYIIIDSLDKLKSNLDLIRPLFYEYNIFRLKANFEYKPALFKDILSNDNTNFEEELQSFKKLQLDTKNNELFESLEPKFNQYFKYFFIKFHNSVAGQASILQYDENTVVLHWVYVRPEFRGNNLAMHLLKKIIEEAKEDGFTTMYLETIPILKTAIGIYEKLGFKMRDYYPTPYLSLEMAKSSDIVFMELEL